MLSTSLEPPCCADTLAGHLRLHQTYTNSACMSVVVTAQLDGRVHHHEHPPPPRYLQLSGLALKYKPRVRRPRCFAQHATVLV